MSVASFLYQENLLLEKASRNPKELLEPVDVMRNTVREGENGRYTGYPEEHRI